MKDLDFGAMIAADMKEQEERERKARKTYKYEKKSIYPVYGGMDGFTSDSDMWYPELKDFTFDMISIPVDEVTLKAMTGKIDGKSTEIGNKLIERLKGKIDEAIQHYGGKAFVKLNTRSAKDYFYGDFPIVENSDEVIDSTMNSMRTIEDMIFAMSALNQGPTISFCFRPVMAAIVERRAKEYRTFVKDGKIVGCTEYFYMDHQPKTVDTFMENTDLVRIKDLYQKIDPIFQKNSIRSYVFDVYCTDDEFSMIEVNPYGISDPCHLNYGDMEVTSKPIILINGESNG